MHKPEGRPQVVAHRGASAVVAEHTLGAYAHALERGADALECDVRLTADGHLVCVHDRTLRRVANNPAVVSTLTLDELDGVDVGMWKHPWADLDDEAPDIDESRRRVLTLRTLLELVRDFKRPIDLAIETKHPTRYGGMVEHALVELLDEFGWAGKGSPARIMSFSPVALTRVEKIAPDLEVVLLIDSPRAWRVTSGLLRPDWIAGPGIGLLKESPRLVERLRRTRRRVHVWTVNTPTDWDLCRDWGVEAVITDHPGTAVAHFS